MEKKPYSAGAVKMSFWFMEFRKVVELLADGKTLEEIKEMNKNENKIILLGITLQGILFFFFNLLDEYQKVVVFILISTISFINLSIYITKLQDYAETKFGSKAYPLRQLSRSILNLFGVTSLTYLAFTFKINYQTIVSFFCFFVVIINIFLIKNKIITYIVEN